VKHSWSFTDKEEREGKPAIYWTITIVISTNCLSSKDGADSRGSGK
jgi:hypothetical protein